jgi:hypothetical protein
MRFGWYIGAWEIIRGWQTNCIYRECCWRWRNSFSSLFTRSLVYQSRLQLVNSFDSCPALISSKQISSLVFCFLISHLSYQYNLCLTPSVTLGRVIQHRTWYWMCLYPSTGCKYCFKPCSVSCCVYLAPNRRWIHVCDDCVNELIRHTGLDIQRYPHRSPY